MPDQEEAFNTLLNNAVSLYVNGVLVQYGLNDTQALEIVSNLTNLPKERLIELKQSRDSGLSQQMSKLTDQVLGTFGVGPNYRR